MSNKRILKVSQVKKRCCLLVAAVFILVSLSGCLGRTGIRGREESPRPALIIPARLINLTVEGADHAMLREFRGKLYALNEVGDVHQRKFAAYQISELEIEYKGLTEVFADQILDMKFSNFSLAIMGLDPTRISVRVIVD